MAVVVVVAAVVTAVMTVLIYMSKEVDSRESQSVEVARVVAVGAAHSGLKLHEINAFIS